MINFAQLMEYTPQMLSGLVTTLELVGLTLLLGACLAAVFTGILLTKIPGLQTLGKIYLFVIRGTPLLVQIYLCYFGLAQFDWIRNSILWPLLREPFACAILALALNSGAYTTIVFRGAINSIPKGEIEAAKALGMSLIQRLYHVIIPRALRLVLPAYSNEVMMVLKGTSLVSTITLLDITGMMRQLIAHTYDTMTFLVFAALLYLVISSLLLAGFHFMEKRYVQI